MTSPPDQTPDPMPYQPLDHAAAHERLADLGLEAEGLAMLEASALPADRALVAHLRGCAACQAEVAATTRLRDALRGAFAAMPDLPSLEPILPPASLRSAVLRAARSEGPAATAIAATASGSTSTSPPPASAAGGQRRFALPAWSAPRWAAAGIAAVLIVAIVGTATGLELGRRAAEDDIASMTSLVATVDRVLSTDPHWVAGLTTADGASAGTVAWTKQDFAAVTTALAKPAAGQVYRCWLVWQGRTAVIGQMEFTGSTAYWTGSVGDWATLDVIPGTRFLVTLEPSTSPPSGGGPSTAPVLQADLIE